MHQHQIFIPTFKWILGTHTQPIPKYLGSGGYPFCNLTFMDTRYIKINNILKNYIKYVCLIC